MSQSDKPSRCSFCGHTQEEVGRLVTGQDKGVYICDQCVALCGELVKSKEESLQEEARKKAGISSVTYFDQAGEVNTDRTIELVIERLADLNIKHIVVATSTGETAMKVARACGYRRHPKNHPEAPKIIAVTLHAGIWEKYVAPDPEKVKAAEEIGVKFLTCTHALMGNVGNAIMEKFGGISLTDLIAHTYYTFSQGVKVAVEIAVSAADAGLIPVDQEIISIAGSDTGADTALALKPAYSTDFFSLRVRELIAKPR